MLKIKYHIDIESSDKISQRTFLFNLCRQATSSNKNPSKLLTNAEQNTQVRN